jgi:hypothetical protein
MNSKIIFLAWCASALLLAIGINSASASSGMDISRMGMGNSGMFQPFYGQPYFPQPSPEYYAAQTGQMNYYGEYSMYPTMDMTPVYISNSINWMGAPRIGFGIGSPVGLSNLGANMMWRSMSAQ